MPCKKCPNRIPIPGNSWIGCRNPVAKVRNVPWGGTYPLCFDENIVLECNGANTIVPEAKNPLLDLVRILGAR